MTRDRDRLERECRTFTRLLSDRAANDYLLKKYVEAHQRSDALQGGDGFDAWLLQAASRSPTMARLADGYSCRFLPSGVLRKKLILTLALVEVTPPYSRAVEGAPARSFAATAGALALDGLAGVLATLIGLLIFGPVHLFSRRSGVGS